MKTIYIITFAILVLTSCNKTKQDIFSKAESVAINATKVEQSEGYTLFKNNCYVCHSVISASHNEIIAPPMVAVKRRYQKSYASKEVFVEAFVNWSKDPKEENALMRGAVQQFKVMPKQVFNEADLKKIAVYIYDNEIEQPEWFEAHFKEEHGGEGKGMGKGKGMGMKGIQNKWIEQMKLDGDNKWDANIETTQGIEKLQEILKNDKAKSTEDFQGLEKKLADVMTNIFDKCTMKDGSHDNLHTFLLPLIKKIDMLKEVSSVKQGKIISMRIGSHLTEYKTFFK